MRKFEGSQKMVGTHRTFGQKMAFCAPCLWQGNLRYPPWDQNNFKKRKTLNSVVNSLSCCIFESWFCKHQLVS